MLPPHRPNGLKLTRRVPAGVAILFALLAMTGCKVDVHLGVRVAENGSGSVVARFVLDDDALRAVGGDLKEQLRVGDLTQAGWEVTVEPTSDGGAEAVAEKGFARPEELTAVIGQLSGDVGPFRDFRLGRKHSTFRTEFEFRGQVDLESGIGGSSLDPNDEGIAAEIEAQGVEIEQLREFLKDRVDKAFTVEVVVDMPGGGSHNAPKALAGAPQWTPRLGEVADLKASSSLFALDRAVLVGIGGVLGVAAIVAFAAWWRTRATGRPPVRRPRPGA